jgi:hypothetical protein
VPGSIPRMRRTGTGGAGTAATVARVRSISQDATRPRGPGHRPAPSAIEFADATPALRDSRVGVRDPKP